MTTNKVRRCKRMIASPGYYRDRAIQMGEQYGAWLAVMHVTRRKNLQKGDNWGAWVHVNRMASMYRRRMEWYAHKTPMDYNDSLDYES